MSIEIELCKKKKEVKKKKVSHHYVFRTCER